MCVSGPSAAVERGDESQQPVGRRQPAQAGQPRERRRNAREPRPAEEAQPEIGDLDRLAPACRVGGEVVSREQPAALAREGQERLGERAAVGGLGSVGGKLVERSRQPRLLEPVAGPEQPPARRVDPRPLVHRVDRREHLEAGGVRRRHRHAFAGEPERRLDEARPRQPAVRAPQGVEAGRHARHRARRRPDRVVDELLTERHVDVDELRLTRRSPEAGHGAEAVEVPHRLGRTHRGRSRGRLRAARS